MPWSRIIEQGAHWECGRAANKRTRIMGNSRDVMFTSERFTGVIRRSSDSRTRIESRKPRNILVITPWYAPQRGGVATAVTGLTEALTRRGVAVSVLLKKAGSRSKVKSISAAPGKARFFSVLFRGPVDVARPLAGLASFVLNAPRTIFALSRFIRKQHIEAVNVHYPTSSDVFILWIRAVTHIPLFVTIHGSDLLQFESRPLLHRLIVRAVLRAADGIICSTNAFRDDLLAPVYPDGPAKASRIPLAIDPKDFEGVEAALPFDPPTPFILCVAKLIPLKGVDVLIKAFAPVAKQHSEITLLLVGDGPARADLELLARTVAPEQKVVFVGSLDRAQVITLMKLCLFFVLPSRFESFGLVNLEAHACGKAVISTRVGGIPEVVCDGVSGLLVDPDDVDALRERLQMLVDDPSLCLRLGMSGRDAIETRGLTWDKHAEKYLSVLNGTCPAGTR